ncbi:nuclear transport factor 2 family protein [Plantactinospora solaniradicis]|uniref:Nuclear transport factor 2 family protein n=1 Tax=Plantactinospora solaniradicis TaxID=1723736 RepID=A0ABW1K656_9ACTN
MCQNEGRDIPEEEPSAVTGPVGPGPVHRRAVLAGVVGVAGGAVAGTGIAVTAPAPPAWAGPPSSYDVDAVRLVVDGIDDAVDAKDWVRCRAFFTDEVDVDFAALNGGPASRMPADDLVAGWRRNLFADKTSFHMRSNHRVTVDGDRAGVRSKGYAFNRLTRPLGDALWEVWGNYAHRLVRTREGWRCSAIALTDVTHARGNELAWTHVPPE